MSVVFNEEAVQRLLNSSLGPVGLFVRRKAEPIRDQIAGSAGDYFGSAPSLASGIAADVSLHMDGSTAVIAINPSGTGRKWSRLIRMAQDGAWRNRPQVILEQSRF